MKPRIPGTNPLAETRREANESVDRKTKYLQIIEILTDAREAMSAKEIAVEMYRRGYSFTTERNLSAPRLNELSKKGILECVGQKVCEYTGHHVGVYALCKK